MNFEKYVFKITDRNVVRYLYAGKEIEGEKLDFSSVITLPDKVKIYNELFRKKKNFKTPPLSSAEIRDEAEKFQKIKKELEPSLKDMEEFREKFAEKAKILFSKAVKAGVGFLYGDDKYIVITEDCSRPGVFYNYGDTLSLVHTVKALEGLGLKESKGIVNAPLGEQKSRLISSLPKEIAEELISLADDLLPLWKSCSERLQKTKESIAPYVKGLTPSSIEDVLKEVEKRFVEQEKDVAKQEKEYEDLEKRVKQLDEETDRLIRLAKALREDAVDADPILFSFARRKEFKAKHKPQYDYNWLSEVNSAAIVRKSMPYLPVELGDTRKGEEVGVNGREALFGKGFDWNKAVEDGKPNLFIEAETDEGRNGRMAMLDNFVATMLLAFPPKKLHFTIIENRTSNSFVNNLPEKICQVVKASDSENLKTLIESLKEKYREGRNNPLPDCSPKEIVVIAGFEKNDRKFGQLMGEMIDVVEDGYKAGIYFAIVLDKDITEYDWGDKDANDFEQYFTPYSIILTHEKDNEGNQIPDYELLRRPAELKTEDGEGTKEGTLGDLIIQYLEKEVSTVPNKVYEDVENGRLYESRPITNLADQSKKEAGKIVVPIAQTENGDIINLQFDDGDYRSCFIFGRSGSGKSYTLHTILTNLMLKYDPSTVDLILIDFKGVELNYYQDVPHVSRLLVNGADREMVNEILSSIMKEMDKRREMFQKADGAAKLGDYNAYAAKKSLEQMKHVILLIDECQNLFEGKNAEAATNVVKKIAREGRSFGIHMVFATQTLHGTDIPGDALKQFSDFVFMNCGEDDVVKCEVQDRNVQKRVGKLVKGEMIYCHTGGNDEPLFGYVFNYAGEGKKYHRLTQENLKSSRFSHPKEEQFYFDASQIFNFDSKEKETLKQILETSLSPIPLAALGKNLSVKGDTYYSKFKRDEGSNLLILGVNNLLQSERVLWNAVESLYVSNEMLDNQARYYILPNIPDNDEPEAIDAHKARMAYLKDLSHRPKVEMVEEADRSNIIERVAATVRVRQDLADKNSKSIKDLDSIYLIIPNQQLFYTKMGKKPRGLTSLDNFDSSSPQPGATTPAPPPTPTASAAEDDLFGFEMPLMPGEENNTQTPDFMSIDMDFGALPDAGTTSISAGKPGRTLDEELRYIMQNGPTVKVHVIMQSTAPNKIYAEDDMRRSEMSLLFNNIVLLQMNQANSMSSLPVEDTQAIQNLSTETKSLRAVAYSGDGKTRTIIPFDLPHDKK